MDIDGKINDRHIIEIVESEFFIKERNLGQIIYNKFISGLKIFLDNALFKVVAYHFISQLMNLKGQVHDLDLYLFTK